MKIAMRNDHTAIELKNIIKEFVESKGYEVIDLGTNSTESCDYPVYGEKVGRAVASGEADLGIAICGTGVGISLAANVLAFGARVVGSELAKMITEAWLDAKFEGGRHERRVQMLMDIENR